MAKINVANNLRAQSERRLLDWAVLLGGTLLLASRLFQPVTEPQRSTAAAAVCSYTALGDVAACAAPADDVDEAVQ